QIGPGGLCGDERVPVFLQRTLRLLNLVVFGQVRTSVRNPCQFAVHLREIEQRTLRYGLCLHGGLPPVLCVTLASGLSLRTRSSWLITLPDPPEDATFHGSVQEFDTWTSTLPAPTVRITSAACAHHGHSLAQRSEEHTSELQSRVDLVCHLL